MFKPLLTIYASSTSARHCSVTPGSFARHLPCSLTGEDRLALLAECSDRFPVVRGSARQTLVRQRGIHDRVRELLEPDVDRHLAPANRLGRSRGQAIRKLVDALIKFGCRHRMIDQTDTCSLGGGEHAPRHQILLGARIADELRPDHGPAIACYLANRDMRIADLG